MRAKILIAIMGVLFGAGISQVPPVSNFLFHWTNNIPLAKAK